MPQESSTTQVERYPERRLKPRFPYPIAITRIYADAATVIATLIGASATLKEISLQMPPDDREMWHGAGEEIGSIAADLGGKVASRLSEGRR